MKQRTVIRTALSIFVLLMLARYWWYLEGRQDPYQTDNSHISRLYAEQKSDAMVTGSGQVVKLLPDDTKGSRHQRFIVSINHQQTLLIAHNIDIAPRIEGLQKGDILTFRGEYEWNQKGGVLHWTHHDPAGRHQPGFLIHRGRTYQ